MRLDVSTLDFAGSPLLAIIGRPVAAIVVVSGQARAMMLVRAIARAAVALTWLRVAGCVALAASWGPLPYALVARHATVRVDHSELGAINDRAALAGLRGPAPGYVPALTGRSFAIRDGRVRWIQIDDPATATVAGLGPGDSLSLVRRFYPAATRRGRDPLRAGSIAYRTVSSDFARTGGSPSLPVCQHPGTRVTGIWLTTSPLE